MDHFSADADHFSKDVDHFSEYVDHAVSTLPFRSGPAPRVDPTPAVTIDSHVFARYGSNIKRTTKILLILSKQIATKNL